jgi:hypothetical protein
MNSKSEQTCYNLEVNHLSTRYKTTMRRGKVVKLDIQTIEVSTLPLGELSFN